MVGISAQISRSRESESEVSPSKDSELISHFAPELVSISSII